MGAQKAYRRIALGKSRKRNIVLRFSRAMSQNKQHPWTLPRAHSRYLLDLRIVVRTKETFIGRTKDIAEGGVGATIPSEIDIGEIVELELQLSEANELLKIKAEVRYRHGFQYGFKFVQITEQQKEMIRRTTRDLRMA
jgi:chromosome condensin MukBEF complex kleisin-like MukF subunit